MWSLIMLQQHFYGKDKANIFMSSKMCFIKYKFKKNNIFKPVFILVVFFILGNILTKCHSRFS